ncbi:hypothetical protein [Achromobacter sp. UMC71]|uniref:hypothetical protein n=1 Tax=Achromobacter sp. UMC71 TaxID=1862320 RepID=UPI0015FFDB16|nr:hypothetical protein [Achromobacter sp. UMC71]MBB1626573.1 hypothetical protein [Achromobacter sp. UMC71]
MLLLTVGVLTALSLAALLWRIWRRPAGKTAGDILRGAAGGAGLFLALGPPAGTVVFALFVTIAGHDLDSLKNLPMMIFMVPYSYLFGGVPALLCGGVAGAFRPARASWRSYCWPGLLGGLYASGFQLGFASRDYSWSDLTGLLVIGGIPGLVSGVACARVLYGKSPVAAAEPDAPT